MKNKFLALFVALMGVVSVAGAATLIPDKVASVIADRQDFQDPSRVRLDGFIGGRITASEANRLVKLDPARLLEGYRKRPGRQSWDGEHVGKWLHAATLAWVNSGDPALREKMDYVAAELVKCQLEDGYLGTYVAEKRWTEWDVWAHKYNLIGLITYMRYTGNTAPLPACRRMADLLCNTFGDTPGKRDIITAGEHVGLAPTSVLEPMVLLYRMTGEPRYLEFCKYLLRAWEQPNGPKVVSTLLAVKRVDKVGNGKAYEMLSCLNGALEYYRTAGDKQILQACLNAWQDIVDKRLYVTGTASYDEHFHDDFDLPNVSNVGETCVTVTWIQFNVQLLRLTGEARFAEQLERSVLNQLFGAQTCDGTAWGYYVQMEGKKPYSASLDGHCCLSSGPRGVALIPTFALSTDSEGVVVNLYEKGKASLNLRDQTAVTLLTETQYPHDGRVAITVQPTVKRTFAVKLRVPAWCKKTAIAVNGERVGTEAGADGYVAIRREWGARDEITLDFEMTPRVIVGDHKNAGKIAVLYGPLVLAADEALLGGEIRNLGDIAAVGADLGALNVTPEAAPEAVRSWPGAQVFRINAVARRKVGSLKRGAPLQIRLIPFADAGGTRSSYKVWLPIGVNSPTGNVCFGAEESRSRPGNVTGSICDDEFSTLAVTYDDKFAEEDWYSVAFDTAETISRVMFAHGKTFHDGGWFDASEGKPRVEVQTQKGGPWKTVGELKDYPATTARDVAGLADGARFTCSLAAPIQVFGIRVAGKPASGDNAQQAFSSCAELQAFGSALRPQ